MAILKPHTAILWSASGTNEFGEPSFDDPIEFICRWQDRNQKYQSLAGDERISNSQIYYEDTDLIKPGDRVAKGSMNSLLLKSKTIDWLAAKAVELDVPWIAVDLSPYSSDLYEGLLVGSYVVAALQGLLESSFFDGSLIQMLFSTELVEGIDYTEELPPFISPYTRMVGAIESTSSVDGGTNLYKAMTEVYAKGY